MRHQKVSTFDGSHGFVEALPRVGNDDVAEQEARSTPQMHAVFHQRRVSVEVRTQRRELQLRGFYSFPMKVGGRDNWPTSARLQLARDSKVGVEVSQRPPDRKDNSLRHA